MIPISERKRKAAKRGLKYHPLNNIFEGCSGHHINIKHVIYIPLDDHLIPHNAKTGENMKAINEIAFKYIWDNIDDVRVPLPDLVNIMRKVK